jgi:hypothetical protein
MPQSLQRTQYAGAEEGVCQERWVASVDLPGIEVPLLGGVKELRFVQMLMASIAFEELGTLAGADIPLRMYLAHKRRQTLSRQGKFR